ncbi:hypothetical protein BDZ94DRAFT_1280301 [Collybia nuda]|uniref:DHHA2 domain-containing protein n=1 Tax=Collybia nuda TaxID=64659 RepID=A0A9P6CMW3_9AGAR|nr:hypothetical protein BDZ94DRAFT_1280301 [Collybia nuda]
MPNPLRRLSLALKLTKPYHPHAAPDATTLAQFLTTTKAKYLSDIRETPGKGGEWTVVMGNEAGDLDSVASAIAYAWIQSEIHKKPTVPLIQTERDDLSLRTENLYALGLAGLDNPKEQLLTITDLAEIKPFPSHQLALVDHNRLGSSFTVNNPDSQVVAVVDHHEDEGLYKDTANPRIIVPAGSCASHVAGLATAEVPAELATLLLCAILIDTGGLKAGGKALQVDYHAAGFISTRSTFAPSLPNKLSAFLKDDPHTKAEALADADAIKDLSKTLSNKKSDLSHLGGWDLLRRDYKQYTYTPAWAAGTPAIEAGLSTVPVALEAWGKDGKLEEAAKDWMKHRNITILGVLTSFRDGSKPGKSGKGKHRRELTWFVREDSENNSGLDVKELEKRLWKGLEESKELKLKKHKKFDLEKGGKLAAGTTARAYQQGNADANRKVIAPLLKTIVEGEAIDEVSEATPDAEDAPPAEAAEQK